MEKYFEKLIQDYGEVLEKQRIHPAWPTQILRNILKYNFVKNTLRDYKKFLLDNGGKVFNPQRTANLLSSLEDVLNGKNVNNKKQNALLERPFDYLALPKYKTRVKNVLKPIYETYGELQEKCYKNFVDKNRGNRSWQGEKEYFFLLEKYRNLGKKSVDSVISHLREINFDFSEESAKKALEKSKK